MAEYLSRNITLNLNVKKPVIPLLSALITELGQTISGSYDSFIDDERQFKLLLNFGSDYQKVIVNQKYSVDPDKILVKLFTPLENFVNEGQPVFISREVAKTTIDKIRVELTPFLKKQIYLRPKF
jgi:hypothetical protein